MSVSLFLITLAIAIEVGILIVQVRQLLTVSTKTQRVSINAANRSAAVGESIASFMEYVAAFQGEDMLFDKALRERASSHLTDLADRLRTELESV